MRPFPWTLVLGVLAFSVTPSAAEPQAVGASEEGEVRIDTATQHDHHRHGYQRVTSHVSLADPVADAGRRLTTVRRVQDWNCATRQVREVRRDWRTDSGEHVRGELARSSWTPVADGGPEARAWELICPREAGAAGALTTRRRVQESGIRLRPPAQVVQMPKGPSRTPDR